MQDKTVRTQIDASHTIVVGFTTEVNRGRGKPPLYFSHFVKPLLA